jgi:CrcB protein
MRSKESARAGAGLSSLEPALAGPAEPTSDGSADSGPVDAVLEGGTSRGATEAPAGGSTDPEAARSAGPAPAGSAVSATVRSALSGPVAAGEEADAEVADEAARAGGAAPATRGRLGLDVVGVGVCGGLTTFSSFTVEVVDRVARGRWPLAVAYVAVSLAGGFGAFLAGEAGVGRWRHRRRSGRGWQEPGAW